MKIEIFLKTGPYPKVCFSVQGQTIKRYNSLNYHLQLH